MVLNRDIMKETETSIWRSHAMVGNRVAMWLLFSSANSIGKSAMKSSTIANTLKPTSLASCPDYMIQFRI